MSSRNIIPPFVTKEWWSAWDYPVRITDQNFARMLGENDLENPRAYKNVVLRSRNEACRSASGESVVLLSDQQFYITLSVDSFDLEELKLKLTDKCLHISGKHEDKEESYGLASRKFHRIYALPSNCDTDRAMAIHCEGQLKIVVPRKDSPTDRDLPLVSKEDEEEKEKQEEEEGEAAGGGGGGGGGGRRRTRK
ncbi:protein lethal(2)essential for life [Caerostris darwini]|uniref:Protein lethal(2)essential for life n=1 Tax=Caerostris darwini TaxID=1538125 RepID=A0AAV4TDP0_9ARAC|nr:protein lethal(2)essential for life [Caerostris darwini]